MAIHVPILAGAMAVRWAARATARLAAKSVASRAGTAAIAGTVAGAIVRDSNGQPVRGGNRARSGRGSASSFRRGGSVPPGGTGPPAPGHIHIDADRWQSALTKGWAANAALDLYDRLLGKFSSNLPQFAHAIVVTVQAGPHGDLRRAYYLALAAAFGRYRNGVRYSIGSSSLSATWDITGKAVSVEIGYTANAVWEGTRALGRVVSIQSDSALRVITDGPSQVTIGGDWPSFLTASPKLGVAPTDQNSVFGGLPRIIQEASQTIGQLMTRYAEQGKVITAALPHNYVLPAPCSSATDYPVVTASGDTRIDVFKELIDGAGTNKLIPWAAVRPVDAASFRHGSTVDRELGLPLLPDTNRVITTGEKNDPRVQNPRPVLDGSTRSSLVALVAAELANPCLLVAPPPCTRVPVLSDGVRIVPVFGEEYLNKGKIVIQGSRPTDVTATPGVGFLGLLLASLFGPDGYVKSFGRVANVRK